MKYVVCLIAAAALLLSGTVTAVAEETTEEVVAVEAVLTSGEEVVVEAEETTTDDAPPTPTASADEKLEGAETVVSYPTGRFGPSWDEAEAYSERRQHEFSIIGGDYLGENWKNTYNVGAAYYFHPNDFLAFGAQYLYSPIVIDKDTPYYAFLTTEDVHIVTAMCTLNTPAAMRLASRIFNFDFYFTLGLGGSQINHIWEPTGVVGGGVKILFPVSWIAFRIDVNSYLHMTQLSPTREELSGDVSMGGAISFLFPPKPRTQTPAEAFDAKDN